MSKVILEVENLSLGYGREVVFENLSFTLDQGDFLGIIGENGSGKTSLIDSILGIKNDYQGKISFKESTSLGYLPQKKSKSGDNFPATIGEIVFTGLLARNPKVRRKEETWRQVVKALESVGLEGLIDRQIGSLSGGQLQRVLLARALVSRPDILILDEPDNNLDDKSKIDLYSSLRTLNLEGMTIIVVSHDLKGLRPYISKLMYLDKGISFLGSYEDFIKEGLDND